MTSGGMLVIGASGLVGSHILACLRSAGEEVHGTGHQRTEGLLALDVTRPGEVRALLERLRPRTVFLAAALTHVDRCQREPDLSHAANVAGVRHVAESAARTGARLVHLSTDYVFDGTDGPYDESDEPNPVSVYGRHKLEAERIARDLLGQRHLTVRTAWVFGRESPARNFVARLIDQNRRGHSVRVPLDQIGSPTFAGQLAAVTVELERRGAAGTFHVAGRTVLSRYDFALLAAEVFGLSRERIVPTTTAELGQEAPRPLNAGLRVHKVEALLGRTLATAREGLDAMRREDPG